MKLSAHARVQEEEKMPGRKPKPTPLKVLEGNPGKRPLNMDEPEYESIVSECPGHLNDYAKEEWERIVALLSESGVLTEVDTASLAGYCQLYGRWVQLETDIMTDGITVEENRFNKDGDIISTKDIMNPKVTEARLTLQQIRAFSTEFGLTPSARSRLSVEPKKKNIDPMEKLLNG